MAKLYRFQQLAVLASFLLTSMTYAGSYTLTDLGVPSGATAPLRGTALNSSGTVGGFDGPGTGFVIAGATSNLLAATLPGADSNSAFPLGINASGTIVGGVIMNGQSPTGWPISHAFVNNGTAWLDPTPAGFDAAVATSINASGQVTISNAYGTWGLSGDASPVCVVYNPASGTTNNVGALGSPGIANSGGSTLCSAINNLGQTTGGSSPSLTTLFHAFVYAPGQNGMQASMIDLGGLSGGTQSFGLGINDAGQVVGWGSIPCADNCTHAFLYQPAKSGSTGVMIDLGSLPNGSDGPWSMAYSINNSGQIVGSSRVGTSPQNDGFLSDGHTMVDLNTLIPPSAWMSCFVTLTKGDAINDSGTILADGTNSCTGEQHVYLLQPPTNNPPVNPCASTLGPDAKYILCYLPPFVAVCGLECGLGTAPIIKCPACQTPVQVSWNAPGFVDDHWADGTSLSLRLPTVDLARTAATTMQFSMSTEPRVQSVSARTVREGAIASAVASSAELRSSTIVAPIVEIRSDKALEPPLERLLFGRLGQTKLRLTLPYHAAPAEKTQARLVRFDQSTRIWVDVPEQSLNTAKQRISAPVPALGKYTIVSGPPVAKR
jgi:probable HAF family extracellular repeat protein